MSCTIRPAQPAERQLLAERAAAWNRDPAQRCLHADETAAAVEAVWAGWTAPFAERVLVAEQDGEVVGVLSFDVLLAEKRAWLFGPFAKGEAWETIAEAMLVAFERQMSGTVMRVSNFVEIQAEPSLALHKRLGYEQRQALVHVFNHTAERAAKVLAGMTDPSVPAMAQDRRSIEALHASAFPNTYTDVATMYERAAKGESLRVIRENGDAVAFVYTDVNVALSEATLQYVAVDPAHRRRGHGEALILASMRFAFETRGLARQILTVFGDNPQAMALYRRLGFLPEFVGVPLEKHLT